MENTPHWKRVWIAVSGKRESITHTIASGALDLIKDYLIQGLTIYRPFSEDCYKQHLEKLDKDIDPDIKKFLYYLSKSLNLDTPIAWALLRNYLLFECLIKIEDTEKVVNLLTMQLNIIDNISEFYTLERMYMLKILYCILEFHKNESHPLQDIYLNFIETFTYKKLQRSLFDQFIYLLNEITFENAKCCPDVQNWITRNNSEQLQVLLLILTTIIYQKLGIKEFMEILRIFKSHEFTHTPIYEIKTNVSIQNVECVEYAIVIAGLELFWDNDSLWYSKNTEIKQVVTTAYSKPTASSILLAWVGLLTTVNSRIDVTDISTYFALAIKHKAFDYLNFMVTNSIFKDRLAGLIMKTALFTLLNTLCLNFGSERLYASEGSVSLLGNLLSSHELAALWLEKSDSGIKSFYMQAVKLFPCHYQSLSTLMESLIGLNYDTHSVIESLQHLQIYTERFAVHQHSDVSSVYDTMLTKYYYPLNNKFIAFGPGTKLKRKKFYDIKYVMIYGSYSYYKMLLHCVNELFNEMEHYRFDDQSKSIVMSGLRVFLQILKVDYNFIKDNEDIKELLRLAFCLLYTTAKRGTKNEDLVVLCFEIAVTHFNNDPKYVIDRMIDSKMLPRIQQPVKRETFFTRDSLSESIILHHISQEVHNSSRSECCLLHLYTQLVKRSLKTNTYYEEIFIPGYIYFITEIFPVFVERFYKHNKINQDIIVDLIHILYIVFRKQDKWISVTESIVHNSTMDLFVNNITYIKALGSIFEIRSEQLELLLRLDNNCQTDSSVRIAKTVKKALSCIMFALSCIVSHKKPENNALEEYLYSYSDISVINRISGYLTYCFDIQVQTIVCSIFSYFAVISKKPIVRVMKNRSDNAEGIFLEFLKDPLADDSLRIAVIKLISASIYQQTSMLTTFFDESNSSQPSKNTIVPFLITFLDDIKKDPNVLTDPLHIAYLDLLHCLWKTNKQHVIDSLIERDDFWFILSRPITKATKVKYELLLNIFEIIVLELCRNKKQVHSNFKKAIAVIFDPSQRFVKIWLGRITALTQKIVSGRKDVNDVALVITIITIWKKFILIIRQFYPEHYNREWDTLVLHQRCLSNLLICSENAEFLYVMTLTAELCLTFSEFDPTQTDCDNKSILDYAVGILKNISDCYGTLNYECKRTMLATISLLFNRYESVIKDNHEIVSSVLDPINRMFNVEYISVLAAATNPNKEHNEDFFHGWVVTINLISKILRMETVTYYENFFHDNMYLTKITKVLKGFLMNSLHVRISEVMCMFLIDYAESKIFKHIQKLYDNLFEDLLLSKKYYVGDTNLRSGMVPKHVMHWWKINTYIIRFNGILVHKCRGYIMDSVLRFLNQHCSILIDGLLSATVVADFVNLNMVISILKFLYDTIEYIKKRGFQYLSSFTNIMNTIKQVISSGIHVILRPRILVFVPTVNDRVIESEDHRLPESILVQITNSFVEIIAWGCLCITRCNSPFVNLMDIHNTIHFKSYIECDFRVPASDNAQPNLLTYGSLLCILNFVCKTLYQIDVHDKEKVADSLNASSSSMGESSINQEKINSVQDVTSQIIYNVFVYPVHARDLEKNISHLYQFIIPEPLGLETPWLGQLNADILTMALNAINTLIAGQAFLTTRNPKVDRNVMRYVRRELCVELVFFYDFVYRRVMQNFINKSPDSPNAPEIRIIATPRKSRTSLKYSSPGSPKISRKGRTLISNKNILLNTDIAKICCNRATGRKNIVTSVDDAYLIVLTHWFRHVCRLVHYSKFDEFLSQWHAKSTCVSRNETYVKNTNVRLIDEEDEGFE